MIYEDNHVSHQFAAKSLSSKQTVSLKPAANVATRKSVCKQSAVSLQSVSQLMESSWQLHAVCVSENTDYLIPQICLRPIVTRVTEL